MHIVPVGVDPELFRPLPDVDAQPGRLITTASADVAMKGLALPARGAGQAPHRARRHAHGDRPAEGGRSPRARPSSELGLTDVVEFVTGVPDERIVELYAEAELAVVPSLYEGFSLPAIEAMACGVPLVATTGGALPEVVGADGETALLVPRRRQPRRSPRRSAAALDDPELRARVGAAGPRAGDRAVDLAAHRTATVEQYRELLEHYRAGTAAAQRASPR